MICIFEKEKYIARIILNRPEASNSISKDLLIELKKILLEIQSDLTLRVLTIEGAGGKVFSAGADLKERILMSREEVISFLDSFKEFCFLLESISIPTIAFINGDAYGGGLEIALSCDLRYMISTAKIGLTETKLGIIPGAGGTQRLSRLIGKNKSKELIYTARKISAEDAFQFGIINSYFSKEEFLNKTKTILEEIISSAPIAVKEAKKSIDQGFLHELEKGIKIERECYLKTLDTVDRNEALAAFKEKRKPNFIGE